MDRRLLGRKHEVCRESIVPAVGKALLAPANSEQLVNFKVAAGLAKAKFRGTDWNDGDCYKWLESLALVHEATGAPQTMESFLLPMHDAGLLLREAQYRTFPDFRNAGDETIGFVSSFDQRKRWHHPQIKVPVGERAAKWALTTLCGGSPPRYGRNCPWPTPRAASGRPKRRSRS